MKFFKFFGVISFPLIVSVAMGQQIRSAGELFVYLDATNCADFSNGAYVTNWSNQGTLSSFVPALPGKGATLVTNMAGAAALWFDGTTNSTMAQAGHTGNATKGGVPLSILGTNTWSAEVWVYNPVGSGIETLLSWTSRRDAGVYRMMEMRYGSDTGNAVEHYGRNIGWTVGLPAFGQWHYVACTRDAGCTNRLYLDGRLVTTLDMGGSYMLNLATNNAIFSIGAVDTSSSWDYPLSGAIAVVRVHDGTLSASDVLNNFQVERSRFGGDWQASGSGAWSSAANWAAGVVPAAGQPVYISNGGTALYDGAASYASGVNSGMLFAVSGALTATAGQFTALPSFQDALVRIGTAAGSAFTVGAAGGVFDTGVRTLQLGDVAGATGTVALATGGRVTATALQKGSGTGFLTADGGTLQAVSSTTSFLQGLSGASVAAGGLTFDVPTNVSVSVYQPLLEDATSPGGGLGKSGAGWLYLYGANTVTGALAVSGGTLVFQNGALSTNFASSVALSNGGVIGCNQTGGATLLAKGLTADSAGTLMLYVPNTNDSVDLSALPGVLLRSSGNFTYTGTLTPYTNLYVFTPDAGTATFTQVISDLPGHVGRVVVRGTSTGCQGLSGDSSYTGGTLLETGRLAMFHGNALGTGTAGIQDIVCKSGTVLSVQAPLTDAAFFDRVQAQGMVSLQIDGGGLTNTVSLTNCPNLFTGSGSAAAKAYFTGTLTPYGTTYLLGDTGVDPNDGSFGLVITNLSDAADGTPRSVLVHGIGVIDTRSSASYSGGTRVENGGKIIVTGDRGFGAVPSVFDPSNVVFDSGVFRTENNYMALAPTRGIAFSGTTRIHASGPLPAQLMIPGDICGSGTLRMTDMGWVTFAGTNNTWNGRVQLEGAYGAMMIGDGTNFNWQSTGGIVGTGTRGWLYLNNGVSNTLSDVFSGNGRLTKKGAGTVTLATAQTFTDSATNVIIESGTLRYGLANALASGLSAGSGLVHILSGAALDVGGFAVSLNGLSGTGCVTNSAETAVALQVGTGNATSLFNGTFASPMTLSKTGSGIFTLGNGNPTRQPVTVSAGTLALNVGVNLTNGVSVASGATLSVNGYYRLLGEYYDNTFPTDQATSWPTLGNTISNIEAVLAGKTPDLVADTSSFGTVFDSLSSGAAFPGKYSSADYFVVRWKGKFLAETAGSYYFQIFADDGCLFFIDGNLVVNNRTGSGTTDGTIALTAGQHDLYVFFYEKGGIQSVRIWMTPPGGTQALLPQRLLSCVPTVVAGLEGAAGSVLSITNNAVLTLNQTTDAAVGRIDGTPSADAVLTKQGAGVLTVLATGTYNGATRISEGGLTLASGVSLTGAVNVANGTLTVSGGTSADVSPVLIGTLTGTASGSLALVAKTALCINQTTNGVFGGTITGGTSDSVIAKTSAAELVLTNDVSAYLGAWDVAAGSLVIGDGGKLVDSASVSIRAGGLLVFRCTSDVTFAGTLTGAGLVRNEGPGTLTLTGSVSSGLQVVSGARVVLGGPATGSVSPLGTCVNDGTLVINRSGTNWLSSAITGSGSVYVGTGTTLLVSQGGYTDGQNVTLSGGTLLLNNGTSLFFDDTQWTTTGVSHFVTNAQGQTLLELNPNAANTRGAAYYRQRVATNMPCAIDVTFNKGTSGGSPGDGFGIFFQNDSRGTNALPSGWWTSVSGYSPSFGFQYYLMPSSCYLAWVSNGVLVGRVDNSLFTQNNGAFTARMTYDGAAMVINMQQGSTTYSMTNLTAGSYLAQLGASNVWVGVVGGTGGSYGQQLINALTYTAFDETARTYTNDVTLVPHTASTLTGVSALSGTQPLAVGNVTFAEETTLNVVPVSGSDTNSAFISLGNLNVSGNSTLAIASQGLALLSGSTWTFNAGSLLTLTGRVTLPSTVHVVINGTIPKGRMNLADLTGATITNIGSVTFVLDGDDGKTQLVYRNGWLYTSRTMGTIMLLR